VIVKSANLLYSPIAAITKATSRDQNANHMVVIVQPAIATSSISLFRYRLKVQFSPITTLMQLLNWQLASRAASIHDLNQSRGSAVTLVNVARVMTLSYMGDSKFDHPQIKPPKTH
jgi:hypothetical protein